MAGDVDGSGHAGGLETFGDQGEEFQFGWNEDKVDLEFKTDDLLSLLAEKASDLDYQLFRQTDQLDSGLRKELRAVTQLSNTKTIDEVLASITEISASEPHEETSFPSPEPVTSDNSSHTFYTESTYLPLNESQPTSDPVFVNPEDYEADFTFPSLSGPVESFPVDLKASEEMQILRSLPTEESFLQEDEKSLDSGYYSITLLVGILSLLILIFFILLLLRYRNFLKERIVGNDHQLHSSGFKSRLSTDDNSRFIVNIKNAQNTYTVRSPKCTVVEMAGSSTSIYPQVSIIGSVKHKPVKNSCANLIKDQQNDGQVSNASPLSSFMPSNPSLDRTSPEGRSCGDTDQYGTLGQDDDEEHADKIAGKENNDRALEEITSISSYFNFQTPTSHLSQGKNSCHEDKTGEIFGEIGLRYIDSSAMEEDIGVRGEETSISSFSTFHTLTSQEDVSWDGNIRTSDEKTRIDAINDLDVQNMQNDEVFIDKSSLCSYHTTASNPVQDRTLSYESSSSGEDRKSLHIPQERPGDNHSLTSYSSFRTPVSNLSLEEEDLEKLTFQQSELNEKLKNETAIGCSDRISIASFSNFYTPTNELSPDSVHNPFTEVKNISNEGEERQSVSSQSTLNFGKEVSAQDKTSSRSSFSEFCLDSDSWIEQEVFKDDNGAEDTEIVSSFSTFNKLMEELNQDHKKTERGNQINIETMPESCHAKDDLLGGESKCLNMTKNLTRSDEWKGPESTKHINIEKKNPDQAVMDTEENADEKTSSEDSSNYSGGYLRLDDPDQTVQIGSGSDGSDDSHHGCSTTPLLDSTQNSPVNSCCGDQADLICVDDSDKVDIASDSEDEIDLTAFKELILQNAGDEKFNPEPFQKTEDKKQQDMKIDVETAQFVKNDSEFLI